MFNLLITNSDLFDKLYQEINRQNTFYFWIIGIVVAIAVGITVFFGVLEWRLSTKQIEALKSEILQKVNDTYKSRIEHLEDVLKQHKQYQTDMALLTANSLTNKFFALENSTDITQQITYKDEITNTIRRVCKNDMVDGNSKVAAMMIVANNIQNAKEINQYAKVKSVHEFIMNDGELKKYYEIGEMAISKLGEQKPSNGDNDK